jgi:hypothetical protein
MNTIIKEWRETRHGNIPINRNFNTDTMLFADDQILIAKSESDLQYSVHNLNKIATKYSLEINIEKTKVMAFKGRKPVRSKICINNKTLEQVNTFSYLGYYLSCEEEKDLNMKNHKLSENSRYHKPNFQTKPSIKIYQNENI